DVIDPPRQALHPPVIRHLVIALPSRRFVAVECEPDENQKRLIVPAQALKPTASNATWGLPFTSRQMLLAPRFEDAAVRVLKDPAARAQLDDFYDSGLAK
ncbi:MAG: hypothetical protein KDB53_09645, partial [Planctomycetes bacterium]|nr:hypothetical protein [Planctomycetota bacterium]